MKKIISVFMMLLMILTMVPATVFSASAASNVIPSGAKEYRGHTYYVFKSDVSWEKAKTLCESRGGHLATISSAKENAFVYNLMQKKGVYYAWLGATNTSGSWKWVTGEKFEYTNWKPGEPNNYYGDQHYIEMFTEGGGGTWSDWAGTWYNTFDGPPGYICEWDMTKKEAKSIRFESAKETIYYGGSETLKILNTSKKATWSSSNKKVAKVSSKGKVTAVGLGSCIITAKIGSKKIKCKVTVKDRNVKASVSFKTNGGGYFIKGISSAKVAFRSKKYAVGKATVYIQNSLGDTVYKQTFKNLAKNKQYSFIWNGKNSNGSYVGAGSYRVMIKIGSSKAYSDYLTFATKNDFAGGSGSKSAPFLVKNITQFRSIVKYPNAYFKQVSDLDFNYTDVSGLFSQDQPFNGFYDGNYKVIRNVTGTGAIFEYLGEKGVITKVNTNNCNVIADQGAILVKHNYGTIQGCSVKGNTTITTSEWQDNASVGFIVWYNYGTISGCTATGSVSAAQTYGANVYAGGIAESNRETGKIISCTSKVNVSGPAYYYSYVGGVVSNNLGIINGCEATGTVSGSSRYDDAYVGGIAGSNAGHIMISYYTGASNINIAGSNTGVIA